MSAAEVVYTGRIQYTRGGCGAARVGECVTTLNVCMLGLAPCEFISGGLAAAALSSTFSF